MVRSSKSKRRQKLPDGATEEDLKVVRDFFSQNVETPISPEQVKKVGQEAMRQHMNSALILTVMKKDYKCGMNMKQLKEGMVEGPEETVVQKPTPAPKATEKAVTKVVEEEITREAVSRVRQVLDTGKGIEDAMGPVARLYGFENTNAFVISMFDFWSTWHEHVNKLVEQNAAYKWAIGEIVRKLTPEALKALEDVSIKEITTSVLMAGAATGHYPDPETLRQYITVVKEEMKN